MKKLVKIAIIVEDYYVLSKKLNNVFTPRNDEVNDVMYIRRSELEKN